MATKKKTQEDDKDTGWGTRRYPDPAARQAAWAASPEVTFAARRAAAEAAKAFWIAAEAREADARRAAACEAFRAALAGGARITATFVHHKQIDPGTEAEDGGYLGYVPEHWSAESCNIEEETPEEVGIYKLLDLEDTPEVGLEVGVQLFSDAEELWIDNDAALVGTIVSVGEPREEKPLHGRWDDEPKVDVVIELEAFELED